MTTSMLQSTCVLVNPSSRPQASVRATACSWSASASSSSLRGAVRLTGRPERRGRRACAVRASASTDTAAERARVKQELLTMLEQTDGAPSPEAMEVISTLQELNPNPRAAEVPELVNGYFQTVRGTVKGRAATNAGVFASIFTLGRAAFGLFKPLKQDVIIQEGYNHIQDGQYVLAFDVSLKNREGESPEFLRGYLLNVARCWFADDSQKMTVTFTSSLLRPAEGVGEEELQSWKRLFQEVNPCMDERGWMSAQLPESDSDLDHLYLDDDLRIVRGTFKNIFILRRIPGPVIPT